ncbi:hypothetical protein KCU95_g17, partial [Aureobasidium melanogenum]
MQRKVIKYALHAPESLQLKESEIVQFFARLKKSHLLSALDACQHSYAQPCVGSIIAHRNVLNNVFIDQDVNWREPNCSPSSSTCSDNQGFSFSNRSPTDCNLFVLTVRLQESIHLLQQLVHHVQQTFNTIPTLSDHETLIFSEAIDHCRPEIRDTCRFSLLAYQTFPIHEYSHDPDQEALGLQPIVGRGWNCNLFRRIPVHEQQYLRSQM